MFVKHGFSYIKGGMQAKGFWKEDSEARRIFEPSKDENVE